MFIGSDRDAERSSVESVHEWDGLPRAERSNVPGKAGSDCAGEYVKRLIEEERRART
jgi:hypothetical protein